MFDISSVACNSVKAKGANVVGSQSDVAKDADFVITMLPNNDIVSKTYESIAESGSVSKKTIFIDSSTIDPNVAKSVSLPEIKEYQKKKSKFTITRCFCRSRS